MPGYASAFAVAALAVLVASPASAAHCMGKHEDDPGCNSGAGGIVEPAVVVDDTSVVVGQADLRSTNPNLGTAVV